MFQVRPEKDHRRSRSASRSNKTLILFATAVLALTPGPFGRWHFALSQQPPAPVPGIEARSRDIVTHLNSVIQFYRTSTQPLQKAGEPNDVVYRDQAVALSSQVADFAFQSAKAQAAILPRSQTDQASSAGSEQQRMQATESN